MSNIFDKKTKKNSANFADSGNSAVFTLAEVPEGCYRIVGCDLLPRKKCRFFEMGFVPQTVVRLMGKAPLGDPVKISARGYTVCVRKNDAKHFLVVAVDACPNNAAENTEQRP